jgi:hypothetical protein
MGVGKRRPYNCIELQPLQFVSMAIDQHDFTARARRASTG